MKGTVLRVYIILIVILEITLRSTISMNLTEFRQSINN